MQSTRTTRQSAAIKHLRLLRSERDAAQDRRYVHLAHLYGVDISQIAAEAGLQISDVRTILNLK